jgi:GTPase SAR1 family protein
MSIPNMIVNESGTATHIENYKIVILGDQYVGKTSILGKYKYETVEEGYAVKYIFFYYFIINIYFF